jgi:hypothetical protein
MDLKSHLQKGILTTKNSKDTKHTKPRGAEFCYWSFSLLNIFVIVSASKAYISINRSALTMLRVVVLYF